MFPGILRVLLRLPFAFVRARVRSLLAPLALLRLGRLLRTVSLPRMREHPLRTGFTILGVALGVAVLVAVVLVSRSIVTSVTNTVGDLAGKAELQIGAGGSGFDESVLDVARAQPGVHKLTPVMQQIVGMRTKAGKRERLMIVGIDLLGTEDSYFRSYASSELEAIRRDPLAFLNSPRNIILSRALAERVGARLHDKISIATSSGLEPFEVWGFIDDTGVGNAFGGAIGIMYYPAMQVAFGRGRNIDRIDLALAPGIRSEDVARGLKRALGATFNVEPPGSRGDRVAQMLTSMRTALFMASVLALLAGAFLVVNTMGISVVQRKRELGICARSAPHAGSWSPC
ncbi:MAG: ABC transporter permease [Myxococcales bacterium]